MLLTLLREPLMFCYSVETYSVNIVHIVLESADPVVLVTRLRSDVKLK